MHRRFLISVILVAAAMAYLVATGVRGTAKLVTSVEELSSARVARSGVRLGARVTDAPISAMSSPRFLVSFSVRGLNPEGGVLPVEYAGIMPDTLKAGRDVILEGDFDGERFIATQLMTQCPSKYVPPKPGDQKTGSPGAGAGYNSEMTVRK